MTLGLTFAMIKTHAVQNLVIVEAIQHKILSSGFRFLAMKVVMRPPPDLVMAFYSAHFGRPYFPELLESLRGPVIPMILEGQDAIASWRLLLGATDPKKAERGTLRAMWGNPDLVAENVAHGSDSEEAVRREIALWFPEFSLGVVWPTEGPFVSPFFRDDWPERTRKSDLS